MPNLTINTRDVHVKMSADLRSKTPEERSNYIVNIQKLVAEILTKLGRISANDHESIERMKNKYMDASLKNAKLQTDLGKTNKYIGIVSFAIMSVRLFLPNVDDKEIINIISNQAPNLGGMYTAGLQSQMQETSAESQLELEKYRTKTAAKQSDGNMKQDILSLLQAVGANQTAASRAGG